MFNLSIKSMNKGIRHLLQVADICFPQKKVKPFFSIKK